VLNGDAVLIAADVIDRSADRAAPTPNAQPTRSFLTLDANHTLQYGKEKDATLFYLVPEAQRVGAPLRPRTDLFYLRSGDSDETERYLHTVKPHESSVAELVDSVGKFTLLPTDTAVLKRDARKAQRERAEWLVKKLINLQVALDNDANIDSTMPRPSLVDLAERFKKLTPYALVGSNADKRHSDWTALQADLFVALENALQAARASTTEQRLIVALRRPMARQIGAVVLKLSARPAFGSTTERSLFVRYGDRLRFKAPLYQRDLGTEAGRFDGDIVCDDNVGSSRDCLVLKDDYVALNGEQDGNARHNSLLVPPIETFRVATFSFRCAPNGGLRFFRVDPSASTEPANEQMFVNAPQTGIAIDERPRPQPKFLAGDDATQAPAEELPSKDNATQPTQEEVATMSQAQRNDAILQPGIHIDDIEPPAVTSEFAVSENTAATMRQRSTMNSKDLFERDLTEALRNDAQSARELLAGESTEKLAQSGKVSLPAPSAATPMPWYGWLLVAAAILITIAAIVGVILFVMQRQRRKKESATRFNTSQSTLGTATKTSTS